MRRSLASGASSASAISRIADAASQSRYPASEAAAVWRRAGAGGGRRERPQRGAQVVGQRALVGDQLRDDRDRLGAVGARAVLQPRDHRRLEAELRIVRVLRAEERHPREHLQRDRADVEGGVLGRPLDEREPVLLDQEAADRHARGAREVVVAQRRVELVDQRGIRFVEQLLAHLALADVVDPGRPRQRLAQEEPRHEERDEDASHDAEHAEEGSTSAAGSGRSSRVLVELGPAGPFGARSPAGRDASPACGSG